MFRNIIYFSLLFLVFSCVNNTTVDDKYVGFLKANDSINIPFNFSLNDSLIHITNATEKVTLQINSVAGDSSKLSSFIFEDFNRDTFTSSRTSDEEIASIIKKVYEKYGYVVDPHTACGFAAFLQMH